MKIYCIVDHLGYNLTLLPIIEKWREQGHEVEVDMYYDTAKKDRADVIICDYIQGGACDLMRDIDNIKVPVYLRGIDIDLYYGHYLGIDLNRTAGVMFIADFMREMAKNCWEETNRPLTVPFTTTKLGIDADKWVFRDRSSSRGKTIGWINNLWSGKGVELLCQIMYNLIKKDPEYKFELAGNVSEPWLLIYLEEFVKINGLENNYHHSGRVPSVDKWMDGIDYMLCTSMKEALSLPMIEGMAKGIKPIIHHWVGADDVYPKNHIYETVDQAVAMIMFDDYNSNEYREWVIREHNLDNAVKQLNELLNIK